MTDSRNQSIDPNDGCRPTRHATGYVVPDYIETGDAEEDALDRWRRWEVEIERERDIV